jgi:GNAT superfamily N-acetyltransferase
MAEGSMSGRDQEFNFRADDAVQVAEGWSLRERLLWRVEQLTNSQFIDLAEHAAEFPELLEGFTTGNVAPRLITREVSALPKLESKATLEDGGSFLVVGALHAADGAYVGTFQRRLQLDPGWAVHELLVLDPPFRGRGIAAELLGSSFSLYDDLGLEQVHLVAGLETGRWYWAHMGFDFLRTEDRELAHAWANEVCEALQVDPEGLGSEPSAGQLARLRGKRDVTLENLANAMPQQRARIEVEVAAKNDLSMDQPLVLGKAVMLTGPQWRAYLQLQGPQRLAFEEARRERTSRPGAGVPLLETASEADSGG